MQSDSDDLEANALVPAGAAGPVTGANSDIDFESEQYQMHRVAILPGQILTETIYRLRRTVVYVGIFYSCLFYVIGILAVCLLAPDVLYLMDRTSPILINLARIAISLLSIGLAFVCIGIALQERGLTSKLALAEVMIDTLRDQALIQMQATRYNLEDLTERLKFPKEESHVTPFDYIDLAKKIGPVIGLLMAKERSVVTLTMEGLKLFQALKKVLKK
jgi:hypothetical protein